MRHRRGGRHRAAAADLTQDLLRPAGRRFVPPDEATIRAHWSGWTPPRWMPRLDPGSPRRRTRAGSHPCWSAAAAPITQIGGGQALIVTLDLAAPIRGTVRVTRPAIPATFCNGPRLRRTAPGRAPGSPRWVRATPGGLKRGLQQTGLSAARERVPGFVRLRLARLRQRRNSSVDVACGNDPCVRQDHRCQGWAERAEMRVESQVR